MIHSVYTAPPCSSTTTALLPSGTFGIVLAHLPLSTGLRVTRLSTAGTRAPAGTSYAALALYRLAPFGARSQDPASLDLVNRRWLRIDGLGSAPITAIATGTTVQIVRDLPRTLDLNPISADYFVALQLSDTSAAILSGPALTASSYSRNPLAGILAAQTGANMGDFPAELSWAAYTAVPVICARSLRGVYVSGVHEV